MNLNRSFLLIDSRYLGVGYRRNDLRETTTQLLDVQIGKKHTRNMYCNTTEVLKVDKLFSDLRKSISHGRPVTPVKPHRVEMNHELMTWILSNSRFRILWTSPYGFQVPMNSHWIEMKYHD